MELTNDFRVAATVSEAWNVLTDVERIAPLLPGAQLQQVEGDEYRGLVKVKVGPITAQYKGTATFIELDESAGRAVLRVEGRDARGQGNASATITATMVADGDGTLVTVLTDLTVTGKVAQFGRGVLADISGKLIGQFVDALEADMATSGTAGPESGVTAVADADETTVAATNGNTANAVGDRTVGDSAVEPKAKPVSSGPREINSPEPEPVDLLDAAGGSVAKRLVPVVAGVIVIVVGVALLRRRPRGRKKAPKAAGLVAVRHLRDHLSDLNLDQLRAQWPDVTLEQLRGQLPDVNLDQLRGLLPDVGLDQLRGLLSDVHLSDVQKLARRGR